MRTIVFLASLMLSSAVVSAATVSDNLNTSNGLVLVNTGAGYRSVVAPVDVGAGARVTARPGGEGRVTYSDGCVVIVNPPEIYTVSDDSPCKLGLLLFPGQQALTSAGVIWGATVLTGQLLSASP